MRMVIFNDPHISAKPPASRKPNYTECILNKLQEIVNFAMDNKCEALCCTGDWVISKRPEATPYHLSAKVVNILEAYEGAKLSAIGNHDVISSLEYFHYSPVHLIFKAAGVDYDPHSGIVYTNYGESLEIATVNFDKGNTQVGIDLISRFFRTSTEMRIMLVHGPIVHTTFAGAYPPQFLETCVWAKDLIGVADYVFYGDIHDYHGVYTLKSSLGAETTFCNMGSIARNSAHELNRNRTVLAAFFDTESREIVPLELEDVLPMEEVFRVEDLEREKQLEMQVSAFVDALDPRALTFTVLSPEILRDRINVNDSLSDREKQIALEAVQTAL